jgi:hypothetical protein
MAYLDDESNLHREDGPAIEYDDGSKEWYQHGKLHRLDGPAVEWADGGKCWYQNDKLHRLDGPAIDLKSGSKRWYFHGKRIYCHSQEEFEEQIKLAMFW